MENEWGTGSSGPEVGIAGLSKKHISDGDERNYPVKRIPSVPYRTCWNTSKVTGGASIVPMARISM
jgi:hypothetical protein